MFLQNKSLSDLSAYNHSFIHVIYPVIVLFIYRNAFLHMITKWSNSSPFFIVISTDMSDNKECDTGAHR